MNAARMLRLLVPVIGLSCAPVADCAPSVFDDWWTPGFNARIRVERCGDKLCGTIVWTWDEQPQNIVDTQPLIGRQIILDMRQEGATRWSGGRIYNPEDGRNYEASMTLASPNTLRVEGCVLFLCKTQLWRRVEPALCPPVSARDGRASRRLTGSG